MFKSYNFDQKENDPQNYYFYEEGFNKEELSTIYKGIQSLEENKADTIGSNSNEVRSSKVRWIPQNDDWHYATENGHYTWHQDIGPGMLSKRKISITVQLSGPEEYEGGDLEVFTGGNYKEGDFIKSPKGMGTVFIFPSYLLHRVTPVTKGIRRSFVLWVGGSPYR